MATTQVGQIGCFKFQSNLTLCVLGFFQNKDYLSHQGLVVDTQHYIAAAAVFASTFLQAAIYIFLR